MLNNTSLAILSLSAVLFTLVLTILLLALVVPEKRRRHLPGFFRGLHDIFNFRGLLIEAILKAFYVFSTIYAIISGFFTFGYGIYIAVAYEVSVGLAQLFSGLATMILGPIVIRLVFEAFMMFILLVKNVISINNKLKDSDDSKEEAKEAAAPQMQNNYTPAAPVWQQPAASAPQATYVPPVAPAPAPAASYVPPVSPAPAPAVEPVAPAVEPVAPAAETVAEPAAPAEETEAPAAETTFCTNCGAQLSADSAFCTNCGQKKA